MYAIFLHFSLKILLFYLFLRPKAGCANTPATTPAIKTIIPTTINRIFIFIPFVVFKMCCKGTIFFSHMQVKSAKNAVVIICSPHKSRELAQKRRILSMETIKLSNGVEMPLLGYGVFQVPPQEAR